MTFLRCCFVLLALTAILRADEPLTVQVQETAEKMTAADIYKTAVAWVAELPNDGSSALEYQDETTSTAIGNGKTTVPFGGWAKIQIPVRFKVRIEARAERYRITFTQIRVTLSGIERPIEDANRIELEKVVRPKLVEIAGQFRSRLKAAKTDW